MTNLRNAIFCLGVVVSGLSVFFVLKVAGLRELIDALGSVDGDYAFFCVVFTFVHILVRNRRWQVTISHSAGFFNCLWAQGVGFIFTMFLPFRLGDVVRAIVLNELEKAPLWTIATTVLIERVIDLLVTLALFLCLVPFLDLPADIKVAALLLAAMSGGVAAALLVGAYLSKVLPPGRMKALIAPIMTQIADALRHLSRQHVAWSVIFWTLLGWGIGVFRHWLALMAFVPDATAMESLMLTVMLSLAVAIPSAPGFIGVFQLVGQQALVIPFAAKYDTAIALGVTVVLHLALFIATTVIGVAAVAIIGRRIATKDLIASFGEKAKSFIATAKPGPPDG